MKLTAAFLNEVLKALNLNISNDSIEFKNSYEWFKEHIESDSTQVEKTNPKDLKSGKIYAFSYKAKHPDRYEYWDRNPIVLILGKRPIRGTFLYVGINISWYPPKYREYIIEKIRSFYKAKYDEAKRIKPLLANGQNLVKLDLYTLRKNLDYMGFSFAIRSYIPENMDSIYCISYENWDRAIKMDNLGIIPLLEGKKNISSIYRDFNLHVIDYQRNLTKNLRNLEQTKNQSSRFLI